VATRADIEINVKGLKKVQELSKQLDKISGKVNQLNKSGGAGAASKSNKLERESASLQEKKRASMIRVRSIGDQIQKAKEAGLKTDKASRALNRAALANSKGKFKLAKASGDAALLELKALKEQSKELTQQKILRASRGGGFGGRGGGRRDERSNRAALTSGAISGAFPLLFGQGPIGGLAGFAGGFAGTKIAGQMGGFAGGLVATAALQTVTNIVNGITDLGKALNTLDGSFNLLKEKSLFSSKEAAVRAQVLQTLGEREKLATLVSKELTQVLGEDGAEKLREAGKASQELNTELAKISLNLQIALAGPLANILKFINKLIDQGNKVSLGEGKGTVNLGPKEDQFIKDFRGVLETFNQDQLDRILRAPIGTNVEGLNVTEGSKQSIRKFSLVKQVNPDSPFVGGEGTETGTNKQLLDIDAARVATAQKKINKLQEQIKFQEQIKVLGIEEATRQKEIEAITKNLTAEELKLLELGELTVEQLFDKSKAAKEFEQNAKKINSAFEQLSVTIGNDIKNGIAGLIKGTSTLGDLLNNVADRFLDLALNQALFGDILGAGGTKGGGLLGLLGFANGGRPPVGKPSIVGEKGPELFVPRSSGTIVPNNKLGGGGSTSVVVNVDASGSDVQGDDAGAKELGTLISVAVQGELLKQQRPGGLLSSLR
jgi:hypothetical protein